LVLIESCYILLISNDMRNELKNNGEAATSHNRTVYASPPVGGSGYEKPQSAYGLCAVFLRHILARRNATHCFMGGPKRRKQPERYVPLG
jgi:hypothetical protein